MSTINLSEADSNAARLITARELSALLQVSQRTLWRLKSAGQLPKAVRLGAAVRWRPEDIKKSIAEGCQEP